MVDFGCNHCYRITSLTSFRSLRPTAVIYPALFARKSPRHSTFLSSAFMFLPIYDKPITSQWGYVL